MKKSSAHPLGFAILAALGLTAAAAQADIVPKQLAGPPSDFTTMRVPDGAASAIHSRSALLPVDMLVQKSGQGWTTSLPVENGQLRFALLSPEAGEWKAALNAPSGKQLTSTDVAKRGNVSSFGIAGAQIPARMFSFDALETGEWTLSLSSAAKSQQHGFVVLEGDIGTELASWATHRKQVVGTSMGIVAELTSTGTDDQLFLGKGAGRVGKATLNVTGPDGSQQVHPMFDDGLHEDGIAGDGIFGADFVATQPGQYVAQVRVEAIDRHGQRILRTAEHLLPFVESSLTLASDKVTAIRAKRGGDTRLSISVPVNTAKKNAHYRSYAEVWGRDAAGEPLAIAWVGGMVEPAQGQLALGLDERWIAKAGAQGPYELRNLRIEDPDTSVTLASAERMDLSLPTLRTRAKRGEVVVDELMTMGPRPEGLSQAKGSGKRLLLVHGYCSGGVWPASQFSNASTFLDQNQNRSHDQFARLIKTFGDTWNSYGIVAHSQGGAAALHLYTYYWSGLDNATGNRLIQSVGTPYQGTNLAGILATMGSWFGVGCGTNSDLSYSGASSWLAGIPNTARAKVNYYTTAFKTTNWWTNDYCQFATDLVLSDPEDGTTEKVNGQLPGGVNRGHTTGQCHTASMRDPAQYLDASRNATMNANAAR